MGRKQLHNFSQHEGLDPLDETEAYATLHEMGCTISAIGQRVGKSRPYASHRMRLLKLHPQVRAAVRQRTLTPGHANTLLRLEVEQQLTLAKQIHMEKLSVKETRQRVGAVLGKELKIIFHSREDAFYALPLPLGYLLKSLRGEGGVNYSYLWVGHVCYVPCVCFISTNWRKGRVS